MTSREKLLRKPIYWFDHEQNELFRQVSDYMEREGINQTELAKRLNVSKGYVSQIMNGNFNLSLKKLVELCLKIDLVPSVKYESIENVIFKDEQRKNFYHLVDTSMIVPMVKVSVQTIAGRVPTYKRCFNNSEKKTKKLEAA